jgi:hypothetical protein
MQSSTIAQYYASTIRVFAVYFEKGAASSAVGATESNKALAAEENYRIGRDFLRKLLSGAASKQRE